MANIKIKYETVKNFVLKNCFLNFQPCPKKTPIGKIRTVFLTFGEFESSSCTNCIITKINFDNLGHIFWQIRYAYFDIMNQSDL